jgi:hypothetical protein
LDAYATYTFHVPGSSVMPPLTTLCGPRAGRRLRLRLRKTVNSARPSARKSEPETSLSARAAEYGSELVVEQIDHGLWPAAVEDDGDEPVSTARLPRKLLPWPAVWSGVARGDSDRRTYTGAPATRKRPGAWNREIDPDSRSTALPGVGRLSACSLRRGG